MSTRGVTQEIGPTSGQYVPKPTPSEQEDMPTYINDELLHLGGIVNGVLEGGAFPPQSELPKRVKEGMMVYFSRAIPDSDIFSAGVYLYRNDKWWKIIDDPSQIEGLEQIFKLTTDDTVPPTPSPSVGIPSGWSETPPSKSSKSDWIWASISYAIDQTTGVKSWSDPVAWSAGVTDGNDGPPGIAGDVYEWWFKESAFRPTTPSDYPPTGWSATVPSNPTQPVWQTFTRVGEDGSWTPFSVPIRIDGEEGAEGQRGFIGIVISGSSWSNQAAWDAIEAETVGLNPARPIPWDNVTIQNPSTGFVETRRYVSGAEPGTWETVELVVDGDAIVNGTLAGNKIISNSITSLQIAADTITGNEINAGTRIVIGGNQAGNQDVIVLDGTDPNNRFWIGNLDDQQANFRVDTNGIMYANGGVFDGDIFAKNINGDVTAMTLYDIVGRSYAATAQTLPVTSFDISSEDYNRVFEVSGVSILKDSSAGTGFSAKVELVRNSDDTVLDTNYVHFLPGITATQRQFSGPLFAYIPSGFSGSLQLRASNFASFGGAVVEDMEVDNQRISGKVFKRGTTLS